uniref:F-box domain-containing protein n=1 Tax=Chenopodium quinoa TaxID=63459 RepID=A0A803KXQ8_CHEQI
MEDDDPNVRPWDELIPDTLGLIFQRLPLDEILNVVPSVCKSWAKAVRGPYCWQEIDIEDWSRYRRPDSLDRILLLLIGRSCGSLRKLCVYGLASEMSLSLIADNAKCLQILRLPGSEISGSMVEQVAVKLSSLTCLDLSYCTKIGAPALEAFGKNCKLLTCLQRNMHPWDVAAIMKDDEAYAISATMPQLKHLELAYLNITTDGAVRILKSCRELELLDIRGCWSVKINEKYLKDRSKLQVVGPLVVDGSGKVKESVDFYPGSSSFWAWGNGIGI